MFSYIKSQELNVFRKCLQAGNFNPWSQLIKIIKTLDTEKEEERFLWEMPDHIPSHSGKINVALVKIEYKHTQ